MYIETVEKFAAVGQHKVDMIKNHLPAFFIGAMMAGAYIGFGDVIMFTAGAHADPSWSHLVMGVVFASALTIVIFAGSELFTGTAMYMAFALFKRTASPTDVLKVWVVCWLGNLAGAAVLAAIMHAAGGGVLLGDGSATFYSIVEAKMNGTAMALIAKGLLCNWLVCLAIWMCGRTENDAAKIFLIFWPIVIFIASGFEHSVANMFAFSMALMGDHPAEVTLMGAAHNLLYVTIGNILGGFVMLGVGYWAQEPGFGHEAHFRPTRGSDQRSR